MKTPAELWAMTAHDERWASDPVAMLEQVMREAFGAGMQAGVELAAQAMETHAAELAANLSMRLPPSVAAGVAGRASIVRESVLAAPIVEGAWCDVVLRPRPGRRRG